MHMKAMKNIKKQLRKLLKDKQGINTILAALLMVVIVVVASVMVYAWSTGLLGALMVTPQVGKEAMNIENSGFTNQTWATMFLRNTGTASISLVTYYVRDNTANQYSKTNWNVTAYKGIPPNGLATVNIDINAPTHCGCTAATNNFVFVSGNSYTVIVVTSRNSQFTFTIVKG